MPLFRAPIFRSATIASRPARPAALRALGAILVAAVVCLSLTGTAATDPAARFNELGHRMMCTCGCAQVLLECNHVGCPISGGMRDELAQAIATGQADQKILDGFVERYGAVVLTAPTFKGFDLVGWAMPFVFALGGLAGTIFLVRHWAKQQPHPATDAAPFSSSGHFDPAQLDALEAMRERVRLETGIASTAPTLPRQGSSHDQ
jgi:cytochrome c-type biogenesis protein CcmH